MQSPIQLEISRRNLLISSAATVAVTGVAGDAIAQSPHEEGKLASKVSLTVNGESRTLDVDNRRRCSTRCASTFISQERRRGATMGNAVLAPSW